MPGIEIRNLPRTTDIDDIYNALVPLSINNETVAAVFGTALGSVTNCLNVSYGGYFDLSSTTQFLSSTQKTNNATVNNLVFNALSTFGEICQLGRCVDARAGLDCITCLDSCVTLFDGSINTLQSDLVSIENSLNHTNDIVTLKSSVTAAEALGERINQSNNCITNLQNDVGVINTCLLTKAGNTSITAINLSFESLQQSLRTSAFDVCSLKNDLNNLTTCVDGEAGIIDAVQTDIEELNLKTTASTNSAIANKDAITILNTCMSDLSTLSSNKIASIVTDIEAINSNIDTVESNLTAEIGRIDNVSTCLETISSGLETSAFRVTQIEDRGNANATCIGTINTELITSASNIRNIAEDVVTLDSTLTTTTSVVQNLSSFRDVILTITDGKASNTCASTLDTGISALNNSITLNHNTGVSLSADFFALSANILIPALTSINSTLIGKAAASCAASLGIDLTNAELNITQLQQDTITLNSSFTSLRFTEISAISSSLPTTVGSLAYNLLTAKTDLATYEGLSSDITTCLGRFNYNDTAVRAVSAVVESLSSNQYGILSSSIDARATCADLQALNVCLVNNYATAATLNSVDQCITTNIEGIRVNLQDQINTTTGGTTIVVGNLRDDINALSANAQTNNTSFTSDITALDLSVEGFSSQFLSLSSDMNSNVQLTQTLSGDVNSAVASNNVTTLDLAGLSALFNSVSGNFNALSGLTFGLSGNLTLLDILIIPSIQTNHQTLTSEFDSEITRVRDLSTSFDNLSGNFNALSGVTFGLSSKIFDTEFALSANVGNLASLSGFVNNLSGSFNALSGAVFTLSGNADQINALIGSEVGLTRTLSGTLLGQIDSISACSNSEFSLVRSNSACTQAGIDSNFTDINFQTSDLRTASATNISLISGVDQKISNEGSLFRTTSGNIQGQVDSISAFNTNESTIFRSQTGVLDETINLNLTSLQSDLTNVRTATASQQDLLTNFDLSFEKEQTLVRGITGILNNNILGLSAFAVGDTSLLRAITAFQGADLSDLQNSQAQFDIAVPILSSFLLSGINTVSDRLFSETTIVRANTAETFNRAVSAGSDLGVTKIDLSLLSALFINLSAYAGQLSSFTFVLSGDIGSVTNQANNTETNFNNLSSEFVNLSGNFRSLSGLANTLTFSANNIESTVVLRLNTKASTDCTDQITLDIADATNDIAITKGNTTFLSAELDTLSSFSIDLSSRVAARALATDVNTLETNLGLSASNIRALREDVTTLDTSVTDCLNSLTATTFFNLLTASQAITERAILTDFNSLETTVTKQGISATNLCTTIDSLNTTLAGVTGGTLGVNVSSIQNLESRVNFQSAFITSLDSCTTTINNNVVHGACSLNLLSAFFNPKIEETCSNVTNLAISAGGQINFAIASLTGLEDSTMLSAGLFESFFSQVRTTSANQDSSITTAQNDITNNRTQFNSTTAEFRHDIQFLSGGINHSTEGLRAVSASQQTSITNLDGEITLVRNVTGDIQDELDSTTAITLNERTIVRAQTGVLNTSINQVDTKRQADRTQANALSSGFEGRIAGSESSITGLNNCVANEHSMLHAITGRFDTALASQVSGFEFYLGVGTLTGALNTAQNNTQGEVNAFIKNPTSQFRILTAGLESNIAYLSGGLEANFLTAGADSSMVRTITGEILGTINTNSLSGQQAKDIATQSYTAVAAASARAETGITDANAANLKAETGCTLAGFALGIAGVADTKANTVALTATDEINVVKDGLAANFLTAGADSSMFRTITGDLLARTECAALTGQETLDLAKTACAFGINGTTQGAIANTRAIGAENCARGAHRIANCARAEAAAADEKAEDCHAAAVVLINNENSRVTSLQQVIGEDDGRGGGTGIAGCVANLQNCSVNQGIKLTALENDINLRVCQSQIESLQTTVGDLQGSIITTCSIAVNAERAAACASKDVAGIGQAAGIACSIATRVETNVSTKYGLQVAAGGAVAGMQLLACPAATYDCLNPGGQISCVSFLADSFSVTHSSNACDGIKPFVVENNCVKIEGACIKDLSVNRLTIGDNVVSEPATAFFCTGRYQGNRFQLCQVMNLPDNPIEDCTLDFATGVFNNCKTGFYDSSCAAYYRDILPYCCSFREHQPDKVAKLCYGSGVGFGGVPGQLRFKATGRPVRIDINTFDCLGQHMALQLLEIGGASYDDYSCRGDRINKTILYMSMEYRVMYSGGVAGKIDGFHGSVTIPADKIEACRQFNKDVCVWVEYRPLINACKGNAYAQNRMYGKNCGQPWPPKCSVSSFYSFSYKTGGNENDGGSSNTIILTECCNNFCSWAESTYRGYAFGHRGIPYGVPLDPTFGIVGDSCLTLKFRDRTQANAIVQTCQMCVTMNAISLFK